MSQEIPQPPSIKISLEIFVKKFTRISLGPMSWYELSSANCVPQVRYDRVLISMVIPGSKGSRRLTFHAAWGPCPIGLSHRLVLIIIWVIIWPQSKLHPKPILSDSISSKITGVMFCGSVCPPVPKLSFERWHWFNLGTSITQCAFVTSHDDIDLSKRWLSHYLNQL